VRNKKQSRKENDLFILQSGVDEKVKKHRVYCMQYDIGEVKSKGICMPDSVVSEV